MAYGVRLLRGSDNLPQSSVRGYVFEGLARISTSRQGLCWGTLMIKRIGLALGFTLIEMSTPETKCIGTPE